MAQTVQQVSFWRSVFHRYAAVSRSSWPAAGVSPILCSQAFNIICFKLFLTYAERLTFVLKWSQVQECVELRG